MKNWRHFVKYIIPSDLLVSWSYKVILNSVNTRDNGNSTITLHWSYKLSASSPFAATFPATKLLVIFVLYRALFFHVVLCCAMLSNVVLWCSVLYNVGLSCCGVLDHYCTMLCYVVLCTMLYYGVWKYYCAEISFTVTVHSSIFRLTFPF